LKPSIGVVNFLGITLSEINMATFYVVLYIFVAIIALLCLVSFTMYMCHLCNKGKDFDDQAYFTQNGKDLNSTETTHLMDQSTTESPAGNNIELVNVRNKIQTLERLGQQSRDPGPGPSASIRTDPSAPNLPNKRPGVPPRPDSITRPPIAVKPATISPRNSIIKPSNNPPPPPHAHQVEVAIVTPQKPVIKPKSAPPPPPESIYENTPRKSSLKRQAPPPPPGIHDPPPTYDDVIIPVGNYLTDD